MKQCIIKVAGARYTALFPSHLRSTRRCFEAIPWCYSNQREDGINTPASPLQNQARPVRAFLRPIQHTFRTPEHPR